MKTSSSLQGCTLADQAIIFWLEQLIPPCITFLQSRTVKSVSSDRDAWKSRCRLQVNWLNKKLSTLQERKQIKQFCSVFESDRIIIPAYYFHIQLPVSPGDL